MNVACVIISSYVILQCMWIIPNNFHLHMEVTVREGCWIKFCMQLVTVMYLIITTACFISLINRYNA